MRRFDARREWKEAERNALPIPAGLELLSASGTLAVSRRIEDFVPGIPARYAILDQTGRPILFAQDTNESVLHRFRITLVNGAGQEILKLKRHLIPGLHHNLNSRVTIACADGRTLGYVMKRKQLGFRTQVQIRDEHRKTKYKLRPDKMLWRWAQELRIMDGRQHVGSIFRNYGRRSEAVEQAEQDKYEIRFPPDAHVNTKAVILGAALFLDFLFHESGEMIDAENDADVED